MQVSQVLQTCSMLGRSSTQQCTAVHTYGPEFQTQAVHGVNAAAAFS